MKATLVLVAALLGFYGSVAWAADAGAGASSATAATRSTPQTKAPRAAARATPASNRTPATVPTTSSTTSPLPRYVDPTAGQGDAVRCACIARRNQA